MFNAPATLIPAPAAVDQPEGVDAPGENRDRLERRLRRLDRALFDLGLADVVGRGFASINAEGQIELAALAPKAFDRLVGLLEDLAEGRPAPVHPVLAGQRSLDLDPLHAFAAVAGPVLHPSSVSGVHPAVPTGVAR